MNQAMIFSGFGGQGIMLMGQLCAQAGLEAGKQVSWFPSYGPEMRGGTAFCSIVLSDDLIGSPVVTTADAVAAMNMPSLIRFAPSVRPGGVLIINSSLADGDPGRTDIRVIRAPMNEMAENCGNQKTLSMIALGVVAGACKPVPKEAFLAAINSMLAEKLEHKPELMALNQAAFLAGYAAAEA